ncbi:hypothetical protein L208DRAFT_1413900 [Tricholoma matsutake]|nr:hypothetical protein L208DRAFT_1413900 [Tricholoma matsutake 945]
MDVSRNIDRHRDAETRNDHGSFQMISTIVHVPLRLLVSLSSTTVATLRPYAPQIIPVLICVLFIPLIILLSVFSGFVVWRSVGVDWETPIHLQFGDGVSPYASVLLPTLVSQQTYDISLRLTIPATESNYALGNFMTSLTLTTPSNKTLTSVRRPTIAVPAKRSFFRNTPSTLSLTVPMLSSFLPGTSSVVAIVEIGRHDRWTSLGKGEGREISIVSSSVRGLVVHHGIRGLVSRFPIIFASLSAVTFLAIILLILGACILPIIMRQSFDNTVDSPADEYSPNGPPFPRSRPSSPESDEKPSTKRRRIKSSRSTSGKLVKVASTSIITSANIKSDPLRRRRSRSYQGLSGSES